jgi:hypothetical protein
MIFSEAFRSCISKVISISYFLAEEARRCRQAIDAQIGSSK